MDFLKNPGKYKAVGARTPKRSTVGWPKRRWKDFVGQGSGGRGQRAILLYGGK